MDIKCFTGSLPSKNFLIDVLPLLKLTTLSLRKNGIECMKDE